MTILNSFNDNVQRLKSKPCIQYKKDGKWMALSWAEADGLVSEITRGLISIGVKKGDKIGILSNTRYEWTLVDLAVLSIGAIVVPIYPTISNQLVSHVVKNARVRMVFVENKELFEKLSSCIAQLEKVIFFESRGPSDISMSLEELRTIGTKASLIPEINGPAIDDVASIIYTSGTTGESKGVIITHANIVAEVDSLKKHFPLTSDDIMLTFLPLSHVLARAIQFFQLSAGCQAAYAESLNKVADNLLEIRPHITVVVPRFLEKVYEIISAKIQSSNFFKRRFILWGIGVGREVRVLEKNGKKAGMSLKLQQMIASALIFSKLRKAFGVRIKFIITGGAALSHELAKFFDAVGLLILEGYGLTETFAAVTVNRIGDNHLGTVGKPIDGVSIKIADDGEILLKGGMVFKGYNDRPDDTLEAFTEDGWFKTGDIGAFSKEGFLRLTDRKKDIIVTSGGKNIAPVAVESLLEESPFISHAAVFGDGKKYVSAVISLNEQAVMYYAMQNRIVFRDWIDLKNSQEVKKMIAVVIDDVNKKLSRFENIRKFAILDHDFTIGSGELTPTMKVRRKLVEEKYKDVLEELYKE